MALASTGFQSSTNANLFMNLTTPIYLPTLSSTNGSDSPHLPLPHHSQAQETVGFTDLAPDRQGVDFGMQSYFRYTNNDNDVLKSVSLVMQLSALAPGAGGSNPCYIDDICAGAIEKVEFQYGGNILQTLHGDEIHFRYLQECPHDELTRKYQMQGAGLSRMERVANAKANRWYYFELPFWWTKKPENAWHQYAFQRLTRIVVTFRNNDYLVQQTGGTTKPVPRDGTQYILNHFLRFEVCCPSAATKQYYQTLVSATGDAGWNYMIQDVQKMKDVDIPVNSTKWNYQLNTFTKFGYNLRFFVRPTANLQPNFLNNDRWTIVELPSYQFDISGSRYQQPLDDYYIKHGLNGKYFLGNEQLPIYNIFFTDYPDVSGHGMGGIEFSNTVNPTIGADFGVGTTVPLTADFYLECHNYVRALLDGGKSAAETIQPL